MVVLGHLGQQSRTLGIRLPRDRTPLRGLGLVDGRVGTGVDDRAVQAPIVCLVCLRVGEVELVDVRVLEALQTMRFRVGANRVAQLAVAARHQGALGSMGLASLSIGWCRSASERSDSSSGIGHWMFSSGSARFTNV